MLESDGCFIPQKETFNVLVDKFKRSRKKNYHFLVRASESFQDAVFKFAKLMIEKEEIPRCFKDTTLHMIFKGGQGKRQILSNSRFIHSKSWFPRTVEGPRGK